MEQCDSLNLRERSILEAVIGSYIATASPVGSRTLSRSYNLGLSPATIRNTMSDLEEKGYLYQPHPSAGRVPTDMAYRLHVDNITGRHLDTAPKSVLQALSQIREDLDMEKVLHRAADALSVITSELGFGIEPLVDEGVLEAVDLIRVSSERAMLVLTIQRGVVKTIFIELDSHVDDAGLEKLASRLNERLTGLTLNEIRRTARVRLKDAVEGEKDPLNIFVQSADTLFELNKGDSELVFGATSRLAEQPEFSDQGGLRSLIGLTESKHSLVEIMKNRAADKGGLVISIGGENELSDLASFTLVTDTYQIGKMRGIIGVIGPTRMSYSRIISVVECTSRLLSEILDR
ncbi:MAG: heat-inducible transcriptional repressor HrcA [Gemmatimonadota bacterium]|nr:heat-inducible transcriptional repressor HrcA [Gemmatimonadota bacterium]